MRRSFLFQDRIYYIILYTPMEIYILFPFIHPAPCCSSQLCYDTINPFYSQKNIKTINWFFSQCCLLGIILGKLCSSLFHKKWYNAIRYETLSLLAWIFLIAESLRRYIEYSKSYSYLHVLSDCKFFFTWKLRL